MSKMGALNLDIEDWVYSMISSGKSFDATLESTQAHFRLSDGDADRIVWDLWQAYNGSNESEPYDAFDLSDDADALASAGYGTDEDYGGDFERI